MTIADKIFNGIYGQICVGLQPVISEWTEKNPVVILLLDSYSTFMTK